LLFSWLIGFLPRRASPSLLPIAADTVECGRAACL